MSAPLLIAAMIAESRNRRPARKSRLFVRLVAAAIAGATVLAVTAPAAAAADREDGRVTVQWAGGPTMLIRFGPILILTDPVLGEGAAAFRIFDPNSGRPDVAQARRAPLPRLSYERAQLVLVSHAHEDHLDVTAISRLASLYFLVPADQAAAVRARGVGRVDGIGWSESRRVERDGHSVTISAVPARHSERPEHLAVLGTVNGYWLEFRRGSYRRTIYWTGDSFPPAEGLADGLRAPDLFVPHLGGVGAGGALGPVSMGAQHAMCFARIVQPRAILPIHHSTFSLYREPIGVFADAAGSAGFRVERVTEGGEVVLP